MIIQIILWLLLTYLALGFIFAIPFVTGGASSIDEGAKGGSWGFKIIIIPGSVVFWPLLLRKWVLSKNKEKKQLG